MCLLGCNSETKKEQGEQAKKQPNAECDETTAPCPDKLKEKLSKCDGGTNIWEKAKKANGGKDPEVVAGSSNFGGHTNISTGKITINSNEKGCDAMETLVFELANVSRKSDFHQIDHVDAPAGNLSRDEFIRAQEKIEYENIATALKAIDACKDKWGCKNHTFSFEPFRAAKDFDDYFDNYLRNDHKEHYGTEWDSSYKAAYEAKHP